MRLIRLNVERVTTDKRKIADLKALGYVEVKNDKRTKGKGTGKTRKTDSE